MDPVQRVVVFASMFTVAFIAPSDAAKTKPDLTPWPKIYRQTGGEVAVDRLPIRIAAGNRQCEIGADEIALRIRDLGGISGEISPVGEEIEEPGIVLLTIAHPSASALLTRDGIRMSATEPGRQGYVSWTAPERRQLIVIGCDHVGALYGAMTLRQMLVCTDGTVKVSSAYVRDWPDFRFRATMSFKRGLMRLSHGDKDMLPGIKAGLDWMMRFKMNLVGDYWEYDARKMPENLKEIMREANAYAIERGIAPYLMVNTNIYGWRGDRRSKLDNVPPPDCETSKDWPCVFDSRSYREHYYCWSDDAAAEARIRPQAELLRDCRFRVFGLHSVDGGSLTDPEFWSRRCSRCRERWGDDERWKAAVHQLKMWDRLVREQVPDITFFAVIYPYSPNYLTLRTEENDALWRQNVLDYWRHLTEELPPDMYVINWFSERQIAARQRAIYDGREISYGDCHPRNMGLFSTHCRHFQTMYMSPNSAIRTTGINTQGNWMTLLNAAEYAWNTLAPGNEEFFGKVLYDAMEDHKGPPVIMDEWLPRMCRAFWGEAIADDMAAVFRSGLLPVYIVNPGAAVSTINKTRSDPLAETAPDAKTKVSAATRGELPPPVMDSTRMMEEQAEAAAICVEALARAAQHLDTLSVYQQRYFMDFHKKAPYWLTLARARWKLRTGDDLLKAGKSRTAAEVYQEALDTYRADLEKAEELYLENQSIHDTHERETDRLRSVTKDFGLLIESRLKSAEVILKPRRVGRNVRVAVYNGHNAKGAVDYLSQFMNVEVNVVDTLGLDVLAPFDCVLVMKDDNVERFDFFQNLRRYVEEGGGGVMLEHSMIGHKRFEQRTPFPEVCKYSLERIDNFDRQLFTLDNELFSGIDPGRVYQNMYRDFFVPVLGEKGVALARDKGGNVVAAAGQVGHGKVVFNGTISVSCVGDTWASEEKPLFGFSALVVRRGIEWFTGVKLIERPAP